MEKNAPTQTSFKVSIHLTQDMAYAYACAMYGNLLCMESTGNEFAASILRENIQTLYNIMGPYFRDFMEKSKQLMNDVGSVGLEAVEKSVFDTTKQIIKDYEIKKAQL